MKIVTRLPLDICICKSSILLIAHKIWFLHFCTVEKNECVFVCLCVHMYYCQLLFKQIFLLVLHQCAVNDLTPVYHDEIFKRNHLFKIAYLIWKVFYFIRSVIFSLLNTGNNSHYSSFESHKSRLCCHHLTPYYLSSKSFLLHCK